MKFFFNLIVLLLIASNLHASDITIENSRIRMMPSGTLINAGYFSITNNTDKDITLVKAISNRFNSVEMHNTIKDGDIMKMIKQESVTIAANSKLEFKPMSYHLMLKKANKELIEGEDIKVTFTLSNGKTISIIFLVKKMGAGEGHDNNGHHNHLMKNMHRPDFVFPVGVKGGKNMMSKKIMFGYKFGIMEMDCCKNNTNSVSESIIQDLGYTMAPIDMSMHMHMFSAMFAINDKFTVMAMLPYIEKEMSMKMLTGMMAGKLNTNNSRGIGDLSITGLYKLSDKSNFKLVLSFPTGEYDEKDHNMSGVLKTLPYPMQISSGTYDVTFGYSFQGILDDWSYGIQLNALTRFDYNNEGWKYGDRREVSAWLAKPISKSFSISFGLDLEHQENINGRALNRMGTTPIWNEYFHSHLIASSNIGINYKVPKSKSKIGIQCGTPIYYDVNGPQMHQDFKCNLGYSMMM